MADKVNWKGSAEEVALEQRAEEAGVRLCEVSAEHVRWWEQRVQRA